MFRKLILMYFSIAILSYLFIGCGIRPQVDFYMNPVATDEDQKIDAKAGVVTVEEEGVTITVSAVDAADLLTITSDAYLNPYIYVNDWGIARPRFTIFDVAISNNRESTARIEPASAVLMDESGEQYDTIPYRALKDRYSSYPVREVIYPAPGYYRQSPHRYYRRPYYGRGLIPRPWYYNYDYGHYAYGRPYYARRVYDPGYVKGAVLKGTMLRAVKLFPGGKRRGLMIFPVLSPDADRLKLIIPGVTIYREGKGEKVDFQFHFERKSAIKGEDDHKKNAGTG